MYCQWYCAVKLVSPSLEIQHHLVLNWYTGTCTHTCTHPKYVIDKESSEKNAASCYCVQVK